MQQCGSGWLYDTGHTKSDQSGINQNNRTIVLVDPFHMSHNSQNIHRMAIVHFIPSNSLRDAQNFHQKREPDLFPGSLFIDYPLFTAFFA